MSDKTFLNANVYLYSLLLPPLREAAYKRGWALGLHGSMMSDMDLIAMPWTAEACPTKELVEALAEACGGHVPYDAAHYIGEKWVPASMPKISAHGREQWTISFSGNTYIDISAMPTTHHEGDGR